jgi:hypothetical protein
MRRSFGKRAAIVLAIASVAVILSASVAVAAPVLKPGVTSWPGMGGVCTDCHTYSTPAAAKPVASPVLFSRPFLKNGKVRRARNFKAAGYFSPTLSTAASATVTIGVERRGPRGRWVATRSFNETAAVSATGKYKNQINYTAVMNINRLGKYRIRAKLVYPNADGVIVTKWSKPTTVTVKKR